MNGPYIVIDFKLDTHIDFATNCACAMAAETGKGVVFDFNGERIYVEPGNTPLRLRTKYYEHHETHRKVI